MINKYFFVLLKLLHAIAKSCQINLGVEKKRHVVQSLFAKIKYYKDEFAS